MFSIQIMFLILLIFTLPKLETCHVFAIISWTDPYLYMFFSLDIHLYCVGAYVYICVYGCINVYCIFMYMCRFICIYYMYVNVFCLWCIMYVFFLHVVCFFVWYCESCDAAFPYASDMLLYMVTPYKACNSAFPYPDESFPSHNALVCGLFLFAFNTIAMI